MTGHWEGPPVAGGPLGVNVEPVEIADWVRFVWSAAGSALESSLDQAEADIAPGCSVGRSRLIGLLPGEKKLVTFDGVLFEVSMEPDPAAVQSSTDLLGGASS